MASASGSKVSLKLLIDTKNRKVLFAEANKSTVDFLFFVMTLPVGTIIKLVGKKGMVGCLANVYESIENLNQTYIQPNQNKDTLLKPKSSASIPLLSLNDEPTKFYRCTCPNYRSEMTEEVEDVAPQVEKEACSAAGEGGGFVKGVVTYMVMDDLAVMPMSTISSIALLNKFNVKEVGALEEKVVDLGMNEALKLLKTFLESKTVLTNVFVKNVGI